MKKLFFIIAAFAAFTSNGQKLVVNGWKHQSGAPSGTTVRKEAEAFDTWANTRPFNNDDADASLYYMSIGATSQLTYGITTAAAGSHVVTFRYRSPNGGANVVVKDDLDNVIATVPVAFSTTWANASQSITLASGAQTIKVERSGNDIDLNYFDVDNSLQSPTQRIAFINLSDQFTGSPDYNGWSGISLWNTINGNAGSTITVAGGIVNTTLQTDHLVKWGWGFTNVDGWIGTGSAPTPGTANTGVFPDEVILKNWHASNGNQIKFTGLNPAKTYTVYALCATVSWEAGDVNFTINSTTSNTVNTSNNYGDNVTYPNWFDDPALAKVTGQAPNGSGELVMTCNIVSGTYVPISALVIKED